MNLEICYASNLADTLEIKGITTFLLDQLGINARVCFDQKFSDGIYFRPEQQQFTFKFFDIDEVNAVSNALMCRTGTDTLLTDEKISTPWVDDLIAERYHLLSQKLRDHEILFCRKHNWPKALPFAVAFTHDVDLTRKFSLKEILWAFLKCRFKKVFSMIRDKSYWTFDEFTAYYERKSFSATYFFIAKKLENLSYRYSVTSRKFRRLIEQLRENGHEVGVHTSRYIFDRPEKIPREKEKLESIIRENAVGVRQHYLRLSYPVAWTVFEKYGFKYDTSVGLNETNGFKAGTSMPYQPWADNKNEGIWEIPFSIMDYPLAENFEKFEEGYQSFDNIAKRVVQNNGLLNILWHPSNLAEPLFRPFWDYITGWLENKNFYQDSLIKIVDWRERRKSVSVDIITENNLLFLQIQNKLPIENLAIEVYGNKIAISGENIGHIQPAEKSVIAVFKLLNPGIHKFQINRVVSHD